VMAWRSAGATADARGVPEVRLKLKSEANATRPAAELTYTLKDGSPTLLVETRVVAPPTGKAKAIAVADEVRADTTFAKTPNGKSSSFTAYDAWFGQAYGIVTAAGTPLDATSDVKLSTIRYTATADGNELLAAPADASANALLARHLFPGRNLLEVRATEATLRGTTLTAYALDVRDAAGAPAAGAEVTVKAKNQPDGVGRTDAAGRLAFSLPAGEWNAHVRTLASGAHDLKLAPGEQTLTVPVAGRVVAKIVNGDGGPTPCKVQFLGQGDTPNPVFGPAGGEHGVNNLHYSQNGTFEQAVPPGKYEAIVSYGPEHDAAFLPIEVKQGEVTKLEATLKHVVSSAGWISADTHSHSSPSGDNTSSQLGRVLNLLCEGIEYAPCTEHNRISSYEPHLEKLGVRHLMGTCTGMELTGGPLPINHQNAFPLVMKPRTQNNGGPEADKDPSAQIERLALWDGKSDKLVQQNHPDIGKLFYDKDADGKPDGGFAESLPFMDVMEVDPLSKIFNPPATSRRVRVNNTVFNWLQLLNQGHRIPGVVSTDAHANFHGSGFLRIYFSSPSTDDPTKVEVLDVVHAAERGNVVMTSGPYLEVNALPGFGGGGRAFIPGDEVKAAGGKLSLQVRVQCPNWFDIDRVQVLVNGRADEKLNFTRAANAQGFGDGVTKFDLAIPVELTSDAHLIVVAAGEKLTMGRVMGPDHGKDMPIAVSNPIYVDADGDGKFTPNGDTLGSPLPVAELPAPAKK
jgi:hypothetical protein